MAEVNVVSMVSGDSVSPGAGRLRTWTPLGAWRVEAEFGSVFSQAGSRGPINAPRRGPVGQVLLLRRVH